MVRLSKLRKALATVSLLAMLLLFADFTGVLHGWLSWLASIQAVPALMAANVVVLVVLAVVTLLCGRIYCSVICPLGIFQDLFYKAKITRRHWQTYSPAMTWLRYIMLGAFVAACVMGMGAITALLDPYSTFGVMANNLFAPLYRWGNNLLAAIAEHYESYALYSTDVYLRSLPALLMALLFFTIISGLSWMGGRTYCNTICPVGTVLGVLSRWSVFGIRIDEDKCNKCGQCARHCKASCIDFKEHKVDLSRCVDCMDCIDHCKQGAISFGRSKRKPQQPAPVDNGRREALAIGGALIATTALAAEEKTTDGGLAFIEDKMVPVRSGMLVPAGAKSSKRFVEKCVQCQLCVSACPNDVLRPSTDLATLMVPMMSYERGYCRPECNRCSEVCPADAIEPISVEDKSSTQIGHARWIQKNCVRFTDGEHCNACVRHCPTGAITMGPSDPNDEHSRRRPYIDESRCIGCGACEHLCPARPLSALVVDGHEVHKMI